MIIIIGYKFLRIPLYRSFSHNSDKIFVVVTDEANSRLIDIFAISALSYSIFKTGHLKLFRYLRYIGLISLNLFLQPTIILSGFKALLNAFPKIKVST